MTCSQCKGEILPDESYYGIDDGIYCPDCYELIVEAWENDGQTSSENLENGIPPGHPA